MLDTCELSISPYGHYGTTLVLEQNLVSEAYDDILKQGENKGKPYTIYGKLLMAY